MLSLPVIPSMGDWDDLRVVLDVVIPVPGQPGQTLHWC